MSMRRTVLPICLLALLTAVGLILFAPHAYAIADGTMGSFSCLDGQAVGQLYVSNASCPTTISKDHLFSFLICNMEQLSSNLLGNMYCGMQASLLPAIQAVLALAVVLFGAAFMIGVVPIKASEFQKTLLKIAVVFVFATNADYMIGVGYNFFITGIRTGVETVLAGYLIVDETSAATGLSMYGMLDQVLGTAISYGTDYLGYAEKTEPDKICTNAVYSVLAIMAAAFPPLAYAGFFILFKLALTFLRAIFSYIYALVLIAFLFTLAPFFLSFFLFKATQKLFDKWLGYLASFTLQVVLLFAFLTFVLSINVSHITKSFTDIIKVNRETSETTSYRFPWTYCTVCNFKAVYHCENNCSDEETAREGQDIPNDKVADFISSGKLVCTTPITPLSINFFTSPKSTGPPSENTLDNYLITFTIGALLSLVVLAYIVDALLGYVGMLAQTLAAGMGGYAPQIGGGESSRVLTLGSPLDNAARDFEAGFTKGATEKSGAQTIFTSAPSGLKEGTRAMLGGVRRDVGNWFGNPNRNDPNNDQ